MLNGTKQTRSIINGFGGTLQDDSAKRLAASRDIKVTVCHCISGGVSERLRSVDICGSGDELSAESKR